MERSDSLSLTVPPPAPPPVPLRPYVPCDSREAAELLHLSRPAFDARRARATLWYELGGASTPVAVGSRPRGRPDNALPLVGVAPPYLGVCLPGAEWVFDRHAVLASLHSPLDTLGLLALGTPTLLDVVEQLQALLERTP